MFRLRWLLGRRASGVGPFAVILAVASGCVREYHYRLLYQIEPYDTSTQTGGHKRGVTALCFSPDGKLLASASDTGSIKIWMARSGTLIRSLAGHDRGVVGLAFMPSGERLVSSEGSGTVKVWEVGSGRCVHTLHVTAPCWGLAVSSDGGRLAASSGVKQARVWSDGSVFRQVIEVPAGTNVTFSADGIWIAAGWDTEVRVWNACTAEKSVTLATSFSVNSVAFLGRGKGVVAGGQVHPVHGAGDALLAVWDLEEQRRMRVVVPYPGGQAEGIAGLLVTPDGRHVICVDDRGALLLLDAISGECRQKMKGGDWRYGALAISADGMRMAVGGPGGPLLIGPHMRVWQRRRGPPPPQSQQGNGGGLYSRTQETDSSVTRLNRDDR